MSRSAAARPKAKSADAYHHGDLREALLAAAREALETQAPEAISLKALASRLGVSQPAPYRHFSSKEALLQAVAEDGFRRFRAALEAAAAGDTPEADGMARSALAYLRFARENPGVYRLMFASPLMHGVEHDSPLAQASSASFRFLLDHVSAHVPPERAVSMAVWIWASLHGVVMLEQQDLLRGPTEDPLSAEAVIRELTAAIRLKAGT